MGCGDSVVDVGWFHRVGSGCFASALTVAGPGAWVLSSSWILGLRVHTGSEYTSSEGVQYPLR